MMLPSYVIRAAAQNQQNPGNPWYCPSCKGHRQASKKLDLWRTPNVLVVHLKRFSYSRFTKNKLETLVDFPIHDFDLSDYVAYKSGGHPILYTLYAVSNHYGSLGGGHYIAFVHAGFPPGVLNVVSGFGATAGSTVSSHMDIDKGVQQNLDAKCTSSLQDPSQIPFCLMKAYGFF